MVSKLAKDDWEDLRAEGLSPTIEDFDRLNQIALPLTDGAETTCANFPRVGWAGDVPFFEPTFAALEWFHGYAIRMAANDETELTLWAFALAHGRDPGFLESLLTPDEIDTAVMEWVGKLPVTRDEIVRACRYAATGFNDAEPAKSDIAKDAQSASFRRSMPAAVRNLAALDRKLAEACAAMKVAPGALKGETISRINRICEAAAIELGKKPTRDESRLRADYDLTYREIRRRLEAEKESAANGEAHD